MLCFVNRPLVVGAVCCGVTLEKGVWDPNTVDVPVTVVNHCETTRWCGAIAGVANGGDRRGSGNGCCLVEEGVVVVVWFLRRISTENGACGLKLVQAGCFLIHRRFVNNGRIVAQLKDACLFGVIKAFPGVVG